MIAGRKDLVDRLLHRALPIVLGLGAVVIAFSAVAAVTADSDETVDRRADSSTVISPPADRRAARDETARPAATRPTAVPPATRTVAAELARPPRPTAPRPALVTDAKPAATPPPAPTPSSATESFVGVGAKLLLGSLLLAGLLVLAARYAKRLPLARFLPSTDGPIKVIGRSHLGPKGSLALIQVGGTTLLVGVTQTSIQALHSWDGSVSAAGGPGGERASGKGSPTAMATAVLPGQLRGLETRIGTRG